MQHLMEYAANKGLKQHQVVEVRNRWLNNGTMDESCDEEDGHDFDCDEADEQ